MEVVGYPKLSVARILGCGQELSQMWLATALPSTHQGLNSTLDLMEKRATQLAGIALSSRVGQLAGTALASSFLCCLCLYVAQQMCRERPA